MPFLHTGMTQVVEILPHVKQKLTSTSQISWVLMAWWRKEPDISNHDIDYVEPKWFGPRT